MPNETRGWGETGETGIRRPSDGDLWAGLVGEERAYPKEVHETAAGLEDVRARMVVLLVADDIYADPRHPTDSERHTFRAELARITEIGGGSLPRGLLRELSERADEPVDGAEIAWPEPVASALDELSDHRARAQLQHRGHRICRDPERATEREVLALERMVAALRRGGDMEAKLIADWTEHHPEPDPRGEHAADLPALRQRCEALQARYAVGHPGVSGGERLADRVRDQIDGPLAEMETGTAETSTASVTTLARNLQGVAGEWAAAVERTAGGPVELDRRFSYTDPGTGVRGRAQVDVVDTTLGQWVEVKNVADFGTGSPDWRRLQRQVRRLCWAAEENPLEGRHSAQVCVEFRRDARRSVMAALEEMGVEVVVKGRQLEDRAGERGLGL